MIPIKDFLNQTKWDKRLNPEEYTLQYLDRITRKLTDLPYAAIKGLDGSFLVLREDTCVPLHRVRKVLKGDNMVWKR